MKFDWNALFKWLSQWLPGFLGGMAIGKKIGEDGKQAVEAKLEKTETMLQLKENELAVEKELGGRTDDDIINDAIGQGSRLIKPGSE